MSKQPSLLSYGFEHSTFTMLLGVAFVMQWWLTVGCDARQTKLDAARALESNLEESEEGTHLPSPASSASSYRPSTSPEPVGTGPGDWPRGLFKPPSHYTIWLTPYLTTRWRRAAALALYLCVWGIQLLWCYWVAILWVWFNTGLFHVWRLVFALRVEGWYKRLICAVIWKIPTIFFSLIMDVLLSMVVLIGAGLILFVQFASFLELCFFCVSLVMLEVEERERQKEQAEAKTSV